MIKLLIIYANWCPVCNMVVPIVEELEKIHQTRLQVAWLDVDVNPKVYNEYKIEIIPTIIIMRGEKEVARMSGMIGEETLLERIPFE